MKTRRTKKKSSGKLKKGLLITLGVFVIAGVALSFIELPGDRVKALVEAKAEEATGRKLTITGPVSLSILPARFTAEQVQFANPDWAETEQLLQVGELDVGVSLWPVLFGNIQVTRLMLKDLEISVEKSRSGKTSFDFTPKMPQKAAEQGSEDTIQGDQEQAPQEQGGTLAISGLSIENATLRYTDHQTGQRLMVEMPQMSADIDRDANLTTVDADLAIALIDMVDQKAQQTKSAHAGTKRSGPSSGSVGSSGSSGPLFSTEKINFAPLQGLRIALDWSADEIVLSPKMRLNAAKGKLAIDRGDVAVKGTRFDWAGGTISADGYIRSTQQNTPSALRVGLTNASLIDMARVLGLDTPVTGGPIEGSVELSSTGLSPAAIAANSNGFARFAVGQATLDSDFLDFLASNALTSLLPNLGGQLLEQEQTILHCMVGRFNIEQGLAVAEPFLMDTERLAVTGTGNINLRDQSFDMQITPKPKETKLLNLATAVDVRGPLNSPRVVPNPKAVAKTVIGGVLGAQFAPVGIIAGLTNIGDDVISDKTVKDACQASLRVAGFEQ